MLVPPTLDINITWQHVHFAVKMYNLLLEFIIQTKGIFLLHGSNNLNYMLVRSNVGLVIFVSFLDIPPTNDDVLITLILFYHLYS